MKGENMQHLSSFPLTSKILTFFSQISKNNIDLYYFSYFYRDPVTQKARTEGQQALVTRNLIIA
jgi:hypothetical protein